MRPMIPCWKGIRHKSSQNVENTRPWILGENCSDKLQTIISGAMGDEIRTRKARWKVGSEKNRMG